MTDTRALFYSSWILEQAQRQPSRNDLDIIVNDINEFKDHQQEHHLADDLWYLETNSRLFVYCKNHDEIIAAIAFEKTPQNFSVTSTAKSTSYKGTPPYMSDLYIAALNLARPRNLAIRGDKTLTDDGFGTWVQLLKHGCDISIYDYSNPGQSLQSVTSIDDLKKYHGDNSEYRKYAFILSEDHQHWRTSVLEYFSVRRLRELANITLDEDYQSP